MLDKLKIKEVGIKLEMRIDVINEVYSYVESFQKSDSHSFSDLVVLGSCIYLASKINEDPKKIRGNFDLILDIINVILFVKSKNEKIKSLTNSSSNDDILYCNNLKNDTYNDENNLTLVNTNYDLTIENVA